MTLPIGSIVASILSAEDFKTVVPAGQKWTLANGDPMPAGPLQHLLSNKSYYKALSKNNVAMLPDLRGMFLRGQNSGHANLSAPRNDGLQNPEHVDVGGYQSDDVGPHIHPQKVGYADAGVVGQAQDGCWHGRAGDSTSPPSPEGGHPRVETRPRNVTVNYFIRIA